MALNVFYIAHKNLKKILQVFALFPNHKHFKFCYYKFRDVFVYVNLILTWSHSSFIFKICFLKFIFMHIYYFLILFFTNLFQNDLLLFYFAEHYVNMFSLKFNFLSLLKSKKKRFFCCFDLMEYVRVIF